MRRALLFISSLLITSSLMLSQLQSVDAMEENNDESFIVLDKDGNPKRIEIEEENIKEDIDTYSVISKDDNQKEIKNFNSYESALRQYKSSLQQNDSVTLMADSQVRATSQSTKNSIVRFKKQFLN